MSGRSKGWVVLLEKDERSSAKDNCEDIKHFSMRPPIPISTTLAKVDESVTFKPKGSDEYGCHLKIKNVTGGTCPIIFKIKTSSPKNYQVKPTIALIEAGGTAKVGITTFPGISPDIIKQDRFQVQVCILPKEALLEDDGKSVSTNSNFDYLNRIFKKIYDECDSGIQTFKVSVNLEPRAPPPVPSPPAPEPVNVGLGQGDCLKDIQELKRTFEATTKKLVRKLDYILLLLYGLLALVLLLIGLVFTQWLSATPSCDKCQKLCPNLVPFNKTEKCGGNGGGFFPFI